MADVLGLAVAAAPLLASAQKGPEAVSLERGVLPVRWTAEAQDCADAPPFLVHEYNAGFFILRQSGCTNFEKPFLYLLLGSKRALLLDTGAPGAQVAGVVDDLLRRQAQRQGTAVLPLLVVHSHGHGDHTAGDAELGRRRGVEMVDARPEAVASFFGLKNWPREPAAYDLGGRAVDIVPIPGHQAASIAIYDRRTGNLLTGDTVYPGRLYIREPRAFAESIDRLVDFTASREVAHVLGAHIENSRTPFVDYPEGTTFQPDERALELGRAHLLELQDALRRMGGSLRRRALRDLTVWPIVE